MTAKYRSWAYSPDQPQQALRPEWRDSVVVGSDITHLPFGNGRSYGDSCLNAGGQVIDSRALDRLIAFDIENGIVCSEPGITFSDLLSIIVPKGWFLPVTPGTSFVTMGGAVANDVHGKNHHQDGTIGRHVLSLELLRSDGTVLSCSPSENTDMFNATIGGCGLTGFVTQIELQLIPLSSPCLDVETLVFHGLEEFVQLSAESHVTHQYTVAWLDCVSSGSNFARGIFFRANHRTDNESLEPIVGGLGLAVPFDFPSWALNSLSVRAFNTLYFNKHRLLSQGHSQQHYNGYFYPLDSIKSWNKIYGAGGFYQYQFVVPNSAQGAMQDILREIVKSGQGSFLAVLKEFGSLPSPGLMSFPAPGLCLALDFPNKGRSTLDLLDRLDDMVMAANGAVYPAKDNRMSAAAFHQYYPQTDTFKQFIDPQFSSDFWQRVNDK